MRCCEPSDSVAVSGHASREPGRCALRSLKKSGLQWISAKDFELVTG